MRRTKLAALMMSLVLLTGCGAKGEDEFENFRQKLEAAAEVSVTAEVSADMGDTVREYTLKMTAGGTGCVIEVLAPEAIAGVRARLDGEGGKLEYEGMSLDTGEFMHDEPTAVTALPFVLDAISKAHVAAAGDGSLTLMPDDDYSVQLQMEDGAPVKAEIVRADDGKAIISCGITSFEIS